MRRLFLVVERAIRAIKICAFVFFVLETLEYLLSLI